ncbi:MAG: tRNA (adenosine(37)-N6)-threonylcarbamoyltransferase complex ATPase subunit type 1 TsaE [Acidimicrobiales bacterium]
MNGPEPLAFQTHSADETRTLGSSLARCCGPGDVVLLVGDLGAGKTTFAQGFAAGLGITEPVTSPTFTLVREYPVPPGQARSSVEPVLVLQHADVYRLDHLAEIADLGLGELVDEGGVALVEWGDVALPVLGPGALSVRLVAEGHGDDLGQRTITVAATDGSWPERWSVLRSVLGYPWAPS